MELTFGYSEIMKTLYALSAETPAIFFNFSPDCGERVRKALHMQHHDAVNQRNCDDAKFPYFEPRSQFEKHKQVVIFLGEVSVMMIMCIHLIGTMIEPFNESI